MYSGTPEEDMMSEITKIAVAYGDGIGPEITSACLRILEAAGARLDIQPIKLGESVYLAGEKSGIDPEAWDVIRSTGIVYKAPLTTPQGGGFKSVNVTLRKTFGLFANVRPSRSYSPWVATKHPGMDVVVVRENEEDTYGGIEHRQTQEVYQCLKLITRPGTERLVRYAFEYARNNNRKKVTCLTKDNIMKLTDGLFHRVFDEVAAEYPDLQTEHLIVDIGTARIADTPQIFDVLVLPNLYGDIISDVTAQLTGSVGLGGSSNIGEKVSMFEAIHGSAPDIAGRGIANPSGMLMAGVMMLNHIGQPDVAEKVHNAWLKTLEDGVHTGDIYQEATSSRRVGTEEFADAVIERLGQRPTELEAVDYAGAQPLVIPTIRKVEPVEKHLEGIDVFVQWDEGERLATALAEQLQVSNGEGLQLTMVSNRGQKVWPNGAPETFCTDHWRCRFLHEDRSAGVVDQGTLLRLLGRIDEAGFEIIKTEFLYRFGESRGYSLGQGE
jgi:isocitrate dehydrogenase